MGNLAKVLMPIVDMFEKIHNLMHTSNGLYLETVAIVLVDICCYGSCTEICLHLLALLSTLWNIF